MNKTPTQWAKAFKSAAVSDNMVVTVQLTAHQLRELSAMMEILALHVSVGAVKELVDAQVCVLQGEEL